MKAILDFLTEMQRSEWFHLGVPCHQRSYNGVMVLESVLTYSKKVITLYNAAVIQLVEVSNEKSELLLTLIKEAEEKQQSFEIPNDDMLTSLINEYQNGGQQNRALQKDYEYLLFVKACMENQLLYLKKFKNIILPIIDVTIHDNNDKHICTATTIENPPSIIPSSVIKGVGGLARHLSISTTKAQAILNSGVLQKNGIANRVGNTWNINSQSLDEACRKDPNFLSKRK